tara:strand:- start:485 stop:691 length:207 start_codon:yes stop_codon:yes gene_type:complete
MGSKKKKGGLKMTLFTVTIIGVDGEIENQVSTTDFAEAAGIAVAATSEGKEAFINDNVDANADDGAVL